MSKRRIFDDERHAHFVTFSCYRRRAHLNHDRPRRIVLGVLSAELTRHDGKCPGFVLMPDHVHAVVWFPADSRLSRFMQLWKQRSSFEIKKWLRTHRPRVRRHFDPSAPVWQPKYYDFNVHSEGKLREKLDYMHLNPVRAGLVERAVDWRWSSARWYAEKKPVGVPIEWID